MLTLWENVRIPGIDQWKGPDPSEWIGYGPSIKGIRFCIRIFMVVRILRLRLDDGWGVLKGFCHFLQDMCLHVYLFH